MLGSLKSREAGKLGDACTLHRLQHAAGVCRQMHKMAASGAVLLALLCSLAVVPQAYTQSPGISLQACLWQPYIK